MADIGPIRRKIVLEPLDPPAPVPEPVPVPEPAPEPVPA